MILKYDSYHNKIILPDRISTGILPHFISAASQWLQRGPAATITLDFSLTKKAFANGMLGIIAIVNQLRAEGVNIKVILPDDKKANGYFFTTNWAHLLDPRFKSNKKHSKNHFVAQFGSFEQLPPLVNNFMDLVLEHILMPKDIQSALEWSVNEICDNVINHAETGLGGFIQVIAYPTNDLIAFTVADAGRGILNSLKEGIPKLDNDLEAIQEAVKAGITRNKEVGQGNGLAGTLRITSMTGGSLDILTGTGRLLVAPDGIENFQYSHNQAFKGTCVSAQIVLSHEFSVTEALTFGKVPYVPYSIVDYKYELQEEDALLVKIRNEKAGTGTRSAGRQMNKKLLNLIEAKPGYAIYVNWENINVIASSYADEFIGKLFVKLGAGQFEAIIKNINLDPVVELIINKAIAQRSLSG